LLVYDDSSDCCQPVLTLGTGSQTRVAPWGAAISTRVVTSKVRQVPGWGANWRSVSAWAKPRGENAARAEAAPAVCKKRRRALLGALENTVVIKRTPNR